MTCEDLLEWAESKLGGFDSYENIEEFENELLKVTDQGSQKNPRVIENVKDKLKDWFDSNLDVNGFDANEIKGDVLIKEVNNVKSLEDLDNINIRLVSGSVKANVQVEIDNKRNELIGESSEIQQIKDQIASAKSRADIDITIGPIQREYGKEIADEIRELIADKADKFQTIEEEFVDTISERISSASTQGQLDTIRSRIEEDAPTTRSESELLGKLSNKLEQLLG